MTPEEYADDILNRNLFDAEKHPVFRKAIAAAIREAEHAARLEGLEMAAKISENLPSARTKEELWTSCRERIATAIREQAAALVDEMEKGEQ